jgi:hypothetical protein
MQNMHFSLVNESKIIIKKKREGGRGSALSSLAQTGGGGGLDRLTLGGLEVNIGGQLQNDSTLTSAVTADSPSVLPNGPGQ